MSDLISRNALVEYCLNTKDRTIDANDIMRFPSAEPERKKGKWIDYPDCLAYEGAYSDEEHVCSECHAVFNHMDNCMEDWNFCPSCGADTRGGNEDS